MVTNLTLSMNVPAGKDGVALLAAFQTDLDNLALPAVVTSRKAGRIPALLNLDTDATSAEVIYVNLVTDGNQTAPQLVTIENDIRNQFNTTAAALP